MYVSLDYLSGVDKWLQSENDAFSSRILEINKSAGQENLEEKLNKLYEMIKSDEYELLIIDAGLIIGFLKIQFVRGQI